MNSKIKVCLIGQCQSGKSRFVSILCDDIKNNCNHIEALLGQSTSNVHRCTLGVNVTPIDGYNIWDIGSGDNKGLGMDYLKGCDVILLFSYPPQWFDMNINIPILKINLPMDTKEQCLDILNLAKQQ